MPADRRRVPAGSAALLDLDGTIIDPRVGILGGYRHALTTLGHPWPDDQDLTWVIGPPLRTTFPRLLGPAADVERCVALYREYYGERGMYECRVYDGMRRAIGALRQRFERVYVCTAKPEHFARPIVGHIGLAALFDGVFGPDLAGKLDDKADLIAHMIAATGLAPERSVMIGDRSHDVLAARRNGMPAVGVLWGFGSREELAAAGSAAVCAAPAELDGIVGALAPG